MIRTVQYEYKLSDGELEKLDKKEIYNRYIYLLHKIREERKYEAERIKAMFGEK